VTGPPDPRPVWLRADVETPPSDVTVVGAGLAGTSVAARLASRGVPVRLLDPRGVGQGTSRLPAAIVRPRTWIGDSRSAEVVATAFAWTRRFLGDLRSAGFTGFDPCGVLDAAIGEAHGDALRRHARNPRLLGTAQWLGAEDAIERAGVRLPHGGLWLEGAGVL